MRRVVTMTVDARVDIATNESTSFEDAKRQAKQKFWRLNRQLPATDLCVPYGSLNQWGLCKNKLS